MALELLPHPLSLFARLISVDLEQVDWMVRHPRAGELRVDGILSGVGVSALVSTGGRPPSNQLRLIGRHGSIHSDLFHGFAVTTRGSATRTGKIAQPFLNGAALLGGASANLVRRFYDAAATGGIAPITAGETIAVSRAAEHIQTRMSPA